MSAKKDEIPHHPTSIVIRTAKKIDVTQSRLAEVMGIGFGTLHTTLTRRSRITPLMAIRYAKAFAEFTHGEVTKPHFWLYKQADWDLYMQQLKGE